MIEILDTNVDIVSLQTDVEYFLSTHDFWEERQISLTSITGNNDWFCSIGSMKDLPRPEKSYSFLNQDLKGTYIAELINKYKKFYRWRLLHIPPGQCYSVHTDAYPDKVNKRIHIPVITNDESYFCYYGDKPGNDVETTVSFHNLKVGNVYEVNTSKLHSAINYGTTPRFHIVGVRYENN